MSEPGIARHRLVLLGFMLPAILGGCRSMVPCMPSPDEAARIESQVQESLGKFEAMERALDVDGLIGFLDPDFYMYQDGKRCDHDTIVEQIQETMPTLREFRTRFEAIEVHALSDDTAWSSMTFHDEIVDASGAVTRMRGPTTFIWKRGGDGRWRLAYADSDHYPVGTPEK